MLGGPCKLLAEIFPTLPSLLNNPCVRAFLSEVGEGIADALLGSGASAEEAGAGLLQTAVFACFKLNVRVSTNGRLGAVLEKGQIDTRPASGPPTKNGGVRNARWFWKRYVELQPEVLSPMNRVRIKLRLSPRVDKQWVEAYPDDAQYMGEILEHHHINCGAIAIPIARGDHRTNFAQWHLGCN
jgi:HNH/Endo VII superfamily nuclease toxin with a HHH motif